MKRVTSTSGEVEDPEDEYRDLCENLGGTYIDMMSGEYMINPLEPKSWTDGERSSKNAPEPPASFLSKFFCLFCSSVKKNSAPRAAFELHPKS